MLAIAGNHDWYRDETAWRSRRGVPRQMRALAAAGIGILGNGGVRLRSPDGRPFWVLGTGSQSGFSGRRGAWEGPANLGAALAARTDEAPAILLLHEPDLFHQVPASVALTLAGHTHGGQVLSPFGPFRVPSNFCSRYLHGHIVETERHLLVSAGIGCSELPFRFNVPPELVLVELG